MANEKRYYWLKFREDFFSSMRIKKLRKMAGGDTYIIIYLKMQLKALKTGGVLEFKGVEQDFADEIALDIDEEPDNVRIVLSFLMTYGLCECSDNIHYFLPFVEENTGSETASTQRSRAFRERQKVLQCNASATEVKRIGNAEKEIEKEIDIEKETDTETEIETDTEKKRKNSTAPNGAVCRTADVRRITEAWNALGLQQVVKVTGSSKRGTMLRARVQEYGTDGVLEAIGKIRQSAFLQGQNEKGWVITFDWFVKPNNFLKVLEGNYDKNYRKDGQKRTDNGFLEMLMEEGGEYI